MKYGLLSYEPVGGFYNEGDYVQSIAARQYLPRVDQLQSRERLNSYRGERMRMILNGWWMHEPENFPPSQDIDPLFVSFHVNRPYIQRMMTPKTIEYLKGKSPIGCRDHHTRQMMESHGIDAYYSACLTTTLGRTYTHAPQNEGEILLVDVAHNLASWKDIPRLALRETLSHLKNGNFFRAGGRNSVMSRIKGAIPKSMRHRVKELTNKIPAQGVSEEQRFEAAHQRLLRYSKAHLVITSRIHCALPCLAMGTPVLFLKAGQTSASNVLRFRGIIDLMNVVDLDGDMDAHAFESDYFDLDQIDFANPPKNPGRHEPLARALEQRCEEFIAS